MNRALSFLSASPTPARTSPNRSANTGRYQKFPEIGSADASRRLPGVSLPQLTAGALSGAGRFFREAT